MQYATTLPQAFPATKPDWSTREREDRKRKLEGMVADPVVSENSHPNGTDLRRSGSALASILRGRTSRDGFKSKAPEVSVAVEGTSFRCITDISTPRELSKDTGALGRDLGTALAAVRTADASRGGLEDDPNFLSASFVPRTLDASSSFLAARSHRDGSRSPPWDWNLKKSMRFTSSTSFDWCAMQSAQVHCAAFHAAGASPDSSRSQEEQLQRALITWAHPDQNLLQLPLASAGPEWTASLAKYIEGRRRMWTEGFTSLYFMLRTCTCPCFYLLTPSSSTSGFVALFYGPQASSPGEEGVGHATLSRSTRGLRYLLREAGVQFTMPLLAEKEAAAAEQEKADASDELFSEMANQKIYQ
ncbi:hypothetical protein CYMTET_20287, partial [Cymbomonas tetramitiformis]